MSAALPIGTGHVDEITICAQVISKHSLEKYYDHKTEHDGIIVEYRGHKDDLAAFGCLKFALNCGYDRFLDDGFGGFWLVESKAGPGKRGFIKVEYFACNWAFAASLPEVRQRFPQMLARLTKRPNLRLVIDNTVVDHV